jgi:hypothetical protein
MNAAGAVKGSHTGNRVNSFRNRWGNLLVLTALLSATGANAADVDTPDFSFAGFGTLGLVHSSEDLADFVSSDVRPDGAGYTHDWSFDVDSLIAAQVDAVFSPKLSAVVQVMAEQNADGSFRPHVEWANIKYQFTPDFSVRVGRTVLPVFQLSDTRKVGYTYTWVRPPIELYGLSPVTATDGADLSYRFHASEWTHTLQLRYGKSETDLPDHGGTVDAQDIWEISDTIEFGAFSAHAAYVHTRITVPSYNALFDAFRQFGPQGVAIAERNEVDQAPAYFVSVGANYDPGDWFVLGEWGRFDSQSALGEKAAWYVGGGYRHGNLTPYAMYSRADADALSDPGLDVSALPPYLVAPALALNAAFNQVLSQKVVANTISIGARWDFMANVDLKLQFDHTNNGRGSAGVLTNPQPGFQTGGSFNVFSATVDFVF